MKVPISAIKGLDAYRKESGDLSDLAHSIRESGLLQPVILWKDDRIVSGTRRVLAAMANGSTVIDAIAPATLSEVLDALEAEHALDRLHALPMSLVEQVRQCWTIESLRVGRKNVGFDVRKRISEYMEVSTITLWRAAEVVKAAEVVGATEGAIDILRLLEETGNATGCYTKLRAGGAVILTDRVKNKVTGMKDQRRILRGSSDKALGLATALPQLQELHKGFTQEEISQYLTDLMAGQRALARAVKTLKGAQKNDR